MPACLSVSLFEREGVYIINLAKIKRSASSKPSAQWIMEKAAQVQVFGESNTGSWWMALGPLCHKQPPPNPPHAHRKAQTHIASINLWKSPYPALNIHLHGSACLLLRFIFSFLPMFCFLADSLEVTSKTTQMFSRVGPDPILFSYPSAKCKWVRRKHKSFLYSRRQAGRDV